MDSSRVIDSSSRSPEPSGRGFSGTGASIGVSVVVPVYRTPIALLRRCLDSLLGQTLKEIQIIAVDDASPDECPAVLEEYAARDPRVIAIHRSSNGRAGLARNDGLGRAEGEFVLFADADDMARRDMCERLLMLGRKHHADIVASASSIHDSSGHCIGRSYLPNRVYDLSVPGQQVQAARYVHNVLWNKLFRRATIAGLKFQRFPADLAEDAVFNFASFSRSRIMVTTCYLGYRYFTANPNSASNRRSKGLPYLESSVAAQKRIIQLLEDGGAERVARHYAPIWAFGRLSMGCKYIADEGDAETRSTMWNFWMLNSPANLSPYIRRHRALALLHGVLRRTGHAGVAHHISSALYRLMSCAQYHALRDDIEARFFCRPEAGGVAVVEKGIL